jgi:magnesium transporter
MTKRRHRHRRPRPRRGAPGSPPGTLLAHGDAAPTRIVARRFGPDSFEERAIGSADELASFRDPGRCLWVEVTGLADTEAIAALGRLFGLHALSLEDALDPAQRAKVEHYDGYTFVVLQTLAISERVEAHPVSLFFGDGFVVTLGDGDAAPLEPVRERLRQARGNVRARGADYLAYALIDTVIDHYFPVVEAFDDHVADVEQAVLEGRSADPINLVQSARQDLQAIRHAMWPARDVVAALLREDSPRVTDETRVHLRDCYDHVLRLQEMVEFSREIVASLLDVYVSTVSMRSNEVMKVLTIVATVFIPLSFIAGVYGMNFNPEISPFNMPEIEWYYGYPFALLLMLATAGAFLLYFRRKGWFGGPGPSPAAQEGEDP